MGRLALVRAIIIAALLLAIGTVPALAANDTVDTAVLLTTNNPSGTGQSTGSPGGSFRYYSFPYGGGNAEVLVHLTWRPGWASTDAAVGFNVYGPTGKAGQGQRGDDVDGASTSFLYFVAAAPGDYLVQVYNYTSGVAVDFTVDVTGAGMPTTTVADNSTIDKAARVTSQSYSASGSLLGSSGGAYNYFLVDYPGGDSTMDVSLTVSPANFLLPNAYGFNVYDGGTLVVSGEEWQRGNTLATKIASVKRTDPGVLGIQVYNYTEGITAQYTLGVTGAAGQVPEVSGNNNPNTAFVLSPRDVSASGSILGNSGGAYSYFVFHYQGNRENVNVSLRFTPGYGITAGGVGINIYHGPDLIAGGKTTEGETSEGGVATASFSSDLSDWFGVQVYNYVPGVTAQYTVYVTGLR
ncbi:MAG: hypothetical protein M1401_13535 [Chloroflexi bacterium]|nr:hypothetical protein [Bacteroidota bacterium]MCL5109859.1 hypothetical protein [Chloroflexota bacterium]